MSSQHSYIPLSSVDDYDYSEKIEVSDGWIQSNPSSCFKRIHLRSVDGVKKDLMFKIENVYSSGIYSSPSGDYLVVQLNENQEEVINKLKNVTSTLQELYKTNFSYVADNEALNPLYYVSKSRMMTFIRDEEKVSKVIDCHRDNSILGTFSYRIYRWVNPKFNWSELEYKEEIHKALLFDKREDNYPRFTSPVLLLRLKKNKEGIITPFYNQDDSKAKSVVFINKPCYVTCAFKVNGILHRQSQSGLLHNKKLDLTLEECIVRPTIPVDPLPKKSLIREHQKQFKMIV